MEEWISQLYKSKGGFGKSTLENRRSTTMEKRRDIRNSILTQYRQIPENMSPFVRHQKDEVPENQLVEKKSDRLKMLEKWKKEKEKRKLEAKKKEKPIFKVCRVEENSRSNDNLRQVFNYIKGKKIVKKETSMSAPSSTKNDMKNTKPTSERLHLKNKSTEQLETNTNFMSEKSIKPRSFDLRNELDKLHKKRRNDVKMNDKFTSSSKGLSHLPSTSGTSSNSNKTSNNPEMSHKNLQSIRNKKEIPKKINAQIKTSSVNLVKNEQMDNVTTIKKLTKLSKNSDSKPSTSNCGISNETSQISAAQPEINNHSSEIYLSSDEEAAVDQSTRQVSVCKSLRKSRSFSSSLQSANLIESPDNSIRISAKESKSASSNRKSRKSFRESTFENSENRSYETDKTITSDDFILKIENFNTPLNKSELKSLRISLQKMKLEKMIASDNRTIEQIESSEEEVAGSSVFIAGGNKNKKNVSAATKDDFRDLPECSVHLTPLRFSVNDCLMGSTPFPSYSDESKSEGSTKKSRIFPKQHCETDLKDVTLSTPSQKKSDCNEFILDKSSLKKNRTSSRISKKGNSQSQIVTLSPTVGILVPDEISTVMRTPSKSPKSLNKIKSCAVKIDSSKSPEISREGNSNDVHICLAANAEMFESDTINGVMKISSKCPKSFNKSISKGIKINSLESPIIISKEVVVDSGSDIEELGYSRSVKRSSGRPKSARRSSRRMPNMDSVKKTIPFIEEDTNCSEYKASQLSRKSIFNTPRAEWKLRLNESFETEMSKRRTSKRNTQISAGLDRSYVRSDQFFTPNKYVDDENLNNDVFVTPDSTKEDDKTVVYISPFVTVSRGKSAARKEYQRKKSVDGLNSSIAGSTDPKSPKAAAAYFERMLSKEVSRIQNLCEIWQRYKETDNLSEDACGLIDMTIGQSNLLLSKKFNQFRSLIEKCRNDDQTIMKIQCEDLHGFWDMIFKQVDDLDKRFENLEDMKKNNWLENVPKRRTPKKRVTKKKNGRKKSAKASSVLKETILAARRKKTLQINNTEEDVAIIFPKKDSSPNRNLLANSSMSCRIPDCSTPGRGILKLSNSKSERRKTVAFQDSGTRLIDGKENKSTPAFKRRDTPLPTRKSERLSLGRSKLLFDCD